MSASRRAASRIDAFSDASGSAEPASPAMAAVHRAWRAQYSDLREARESAANAVALADASDDAAARAAGLFQSAYAAIRLGLSAEAAQATAACRASFGAEGDARGLWLAAALEALCARLDGDAERSIALLEGLAARPPADAAPAELFIVHVALSLGYRFVGLLEPALKWHYRAVDTARRTNEPLLLASTLCNLGGYHSDLYNPDEGSRLLREALALSTACGGDRTTLIVALNLCQTYAALGRHDEALELAERYLTADRYLRTVGGDEPIIPLTLALVYANAGRPGDAARVLDAVHDQLVRGFDEGTPQVFQAYVEARIALAAGDAEKAAASARALLDEIDETTVDSPSDLMHLHAAAADAHERLGDHRAALHHERARAVIRERLSRLAVHVAGLTDNIRDELDSARAERDRILVLHAELEREHERLAALNRALTAQVAENRRLHEELKEQSYRDALTGLHNRRFLYERGPDLLTTSLAAGTTLFVAMLDLDHFKMLNDAYGHVVGDRSLVALGRILREGLREDDLVCRIGGEEFALILPASTAAVAEARLDAMLEACRQIRPLDNGAALPAPLTFSAGVVAAPEHGTTIDALMVAADALLYEAKHAGRARIAFAAGTRPSTDAPSAAARQPLDH